MAWPLLMSKGWAQARLLRPTIPLYRRAVPWEQVLRSSCDTSMAGS
jgi:hypothetical protein